MNLATTSSLNRTLGGAIAAIALVAIISASAVYVTLRQADAAFEARTRSNRIIRLLDDFWAAMLNQETATRGFLITGDVSSLEPYRLARPELDKAIATLHQFIGDDPYLVDAEHAAHAWQEQDGDVVVRSAIDPTLREAAIRIERSGQGKALFDNVRARLTSIEREQTDELRRLNAIVTKARQTTAWALAIGGLLVVGICIIVGVAINRVVVRPMLSLASVMHRLSQRDLTAEVTGTHRRNEVGAMARAVQVFKSGLIELDRTSLLWATANTMPALVGYIGSDRRIGFLNDEFARWFKLPSDDSTSVTGRRLAEIFPANSFPGAGGALETAFGGGEMTFEWTMQHPAGGKRELKAYYRPHRGLDGQVQGVVTLLTDITDHKILENRLAQQARDLSRSNEELEQFAYVASHDLKAPLRGIDNLVTWIEEDLEGSLSGDTRTNMSLVKSRVRRLESLLDDLLAYSRAGRTDAAVEMVDTRAMVRELAELITPPEGFSITGDETLPSMRTARAPLVQVLQNLMSNAIKHHDDPACGHIWVEARETPWSVEFIVSDDGPGIPAQYRDRVFGMFQTLKPRDEVEGSGMGLAIVKKLAETQGGRVWLTDRSGGRGLSVHFTWPKR